MDNNSNKNNDIDSILNEIKERSDVKDQKPQEKSQNDQTVTEQTVTEKTDTNTERQNARGEKQPEVTDSVQYKTDPAAVSEKNDEKAEFKIDFKKDYYKIKDYKQKKHMSRGAKIFVRLMTLVIIVGISVIASLGILFAINDMYAFNKNDVQITVTIPKSSTLEDISQILEDSGVIRSSFLFRMYHKFFESDAKYNYGTFALNSNMSYEFISAELQKYTHSDEVVRVTFPEGYTLNQIAQKLEENKVCTADDFIMAVEETDFGYWFEDEIPQNKLRYYQLEGYLFPDTYDFYINENPVSVADKLLKNFDKKITDLIKARMQELDITLDQTIILASIIQGEAGHTEQMKLVSSVYWNRLNNPGEFPKLQADPTTGYSKEISKTMDIRDDEILAAYDTYQGEGLPPGAINNPGTDAIMAALYPEQTDYYYFCTNLETGEFFYAVTLDEHNQNLYKAGLR